MTTITEKTLKYTAVLRVSSKDDREIERTQRFNEGFGSFREYASLLEETEDEVGLLFDY